MRLTFHPAARRELEESAIFYEDRAEGLGQEFVKEVRAATDTVMENPEIGFSVSARLRRHLLRRFPYSVLYRASDEELRILAVMHHRRKPGYWKGRE